MDPQHRPTSQILTQSQSPPSPAPLPPHAPLPSHSREAASSNQALERTASAVTVPTGLHRHLSTHRQVPRPLRLSLSLRSFGTATRTMRTTIFLFTFLGLFIVARASDPKTVTKTSKRLFDIPKEVVGFVERLVETNPNISAKYAQLITPTEDEAGGHFDVGPFVAIEWLVPEASGNFDDSGGTRDYKGVFLVRRQLRSGFHRGYSVEDNVVARVTVNEHQDLKPNPKKDGDFILTHTKLTLHFDGFVSVKLNPK